MSVAPVLLYLEADDEVTTVVRRVRKADSDRVVLVAPGRSRATSSVVALRLLARVADEAGVAIAIAGDALTRSLASEAGLDTYASVEDARNAVLASPAESGARRASIHVVRGPDADDTAAVRAVVTAAPDPLDDATQVRPLPVAARTAPATSRRWRHLPLAGLLALLMVLVVGGGVLGAVVLPAATIELTPRSEQIGPFEYEIEFPDAERVTGNVQDTATVTATGTYPIQASAAGTVVLYNWTFAPQAVPAGTLVAAGDQAFATQADVTVPRGALTADGRIAAGDESVAVVAAAPGPNANVAAGAIDTILNQGVDQRLRGFPENPQRRVENLEPTAGGLDTTGPEITQADVDAAVAALRMALERQVAETLGSTSGAVFADATAAPEPVLDGVDGLVGTRDQAEAHIGGTLAYDRLSVEQPEVTTRAEEQLAADDAALPPGHELLPGAIQVSIGEARVEGDLLVVAVSVSGASAPRIDHDQVMRLVRGRSQQEAEEALAKLGAASVQLWPGWVASVPELDWRIDVRIGGVGDQPVPSGS